MSDARDRLEARVAGDYTSGGFRDTENGTKRYISDLNDVAAVCQETANFAAMAEAGAAQADAWRKESATVARVDASNFTVVGDKTSRYVANRAVELVQTASGYGHVSSSSYSSGTGLTTVTVTGITVDSGLSEVWYGQDPASAPPALSAASDAEAKAGTLTTKAITPANLKTVLDMRAPNRNWIINGCGIVYQRAATYTLVKDTYGFAADRIACMATGTAVSAGILTRTSSSPAGSSGYAVMAYQVTLTGTGILYFRYRMESLDAFRFVNQAASFAAQVYHNVGSAVNYTITVRKANSADNFSAVTEIANSGAISVPSGAATQIKFENINTGNLGACSNGIEIEVKIACGAITTKDFHITEMQFELGSTATSFSWKSIQEETDQCMRYYQTNGGGLAACAAASGYFVDGEVVYCSTRYGIPIRASIAPTLAESGSSLNFNSPVLGTYNQHGFYQYRVKTGGSNDGYYFTTWYVNAEL